MKEFLDFSRTLIIMSTVCWVLFGFVIGIDTVQNEDMKPRLTAGDIIIYYRPDKSPDIREIIVIKKNETKYIGRVVAAGGDKVEIMETGGIKINDAAYVENYIYESTYPLTTLEYPVVLAEDEYFILADARGSGEDSRYFGVIKQSEIQGKAAGLFRRSGF